MAEVLKELGEKCQKPHWKEVGNWMVRKIERPLALFITAQLIKTPVSANQVTALSVLAALAGAFFFLFPNPAAFLVGVLFFHLWYLLDHVDGQIARYRKTESLSGAYFDYLTHYVVHAAFFIALGFQAFFLTQHILYLFLAVSAGIGSMLVGVFYDTRYKAIFHKLTQEKKAEWIGYQDPIEKLQEVKTKEVSPLKKVFSLLYKSLEIHVALNTVTVIALISLGWSRFLGIPWIVWLSFYYGILFPVVFCLRAYDHIHNRKIEADFGSYFKTGPV